MYYTTSEAARKPERVRARAASLICGLPVRTVQHLAAQGVIPGAAKLGGQWTFDEVTLRAWIRRREAERCRTYISEARHGGVVSRLPDVTIDEAYERAIGLRPSAGLRLGEHR